jgi:hypothetical protein
MTTGDCASFSCPAYLLCVTGRVQYYDDIHGQAIDDITGVLDGEYYLSRCHMCGVLEICYRYPVRLRFLNHWYDLEACSGLSCSATAYRGRCWRCGDRTRKEAKQEDNE